MADVVDHVIFSHGCGWQRQVDRWLHVGPNFVLQSLDYEPIATPRWPPCCTDMTRTKKPPDAHSSLPGVGSAGGLTSTQGLTMERVEDISPC